MIALILSAFAEDIEARRLVVELNRLAAENQWGGVERTYRKLVLDHPVGLTPAIHVLGEKAASSRGDLMLAAQRLMRLGSLDEGYDEATVRLGRIRTRMQLVVVPAGGTLAAAVAPFEPDLALAVRFAQSELEERSVFIGLLPVGDYTIDGKPVHLVGGFEPLTLVP